MKARLAVVAAVLVFAALLALTASDRQAAAQVIKLLPWVPKFARLQRACLQDVGEELSNARGYDVIIDLASGLPTQDHIHKVVKPGTLVIYSDRDPLVLVTRSGGSRDRSVGLENTCRSASFQPSLVSSWTSTS